MASKTQMIEVVGKLKWAKLFGFNRDKGDYHKDTDGVTCVDVYPNAAGVKALKASGTQTRAKLDDDTDERFYKFRRPWKTDYDWQCGAPAIYDAAGNEWDVETMGLIGNGSIGVVTLAVYPTKKGNGTRLEAVQIIKHVPFESDGDGKGGGYTYKPRDFTASEIDLSEFGDDGDDEPKPKPKKAPAKGRRKQVDDDNDLDDEIPF